MTEPHVHPPAFLTTPSGLQPPDSRRVDAIDRRLPQTQCQRCGFPACRPYAEAIAVGSADINRCPPGGSAAIAAIAELLNRPPKPLDLECGPEITPGVAVIDELRCIGCTLCIRACPVDAILGANKHMHTVITDACTGCELCVEPCPVDCIQMVSSPVSVDEQHRGARADAARRRFRARQRRLARQQQERQARSRRHRQALCGMQDGRDAKRQAIQAALERARRERARTAKRPPGAQRAE